MWPPEHDQEGHPYHFPNHFGRHSLLLRNERTPIRPRRAARNISPMCCRSGKVSEVGALLSFTAQGSSFTHLNHKSAGHYACVVHGFDKHIFPGWFDCVVGLNRFADLRGAWLSPPASFVSDGNSCSRPKPSHGTNGMPSPFLAWWLWECGHLSTPQVTKSKQDSILDKHSMDVKPLLKFVTFCTLVVVSKPVQQAIGIVGLVFDGIIANYWYFCQFFSFFLVLTAWIIFDRMNKAIKCGKLSIKQLPEVKLKFPRIDR